MARPPKLTTFSLRDRYNGASKGGGTLTVLYVDTLFVLNALVDYFLLLGAARLAGEPLRRLRFGLGAGLGGGYAVCMFLPGLAFLSRPLCRAACCALMLVTAYGGSRRLLRQGVIFLALTCAFGGGVVALGLWSGRGLSLGHGVFYSALDVKTLLLSAAVCYAGITGALNRVGRHTAAGGELFPIRLRLGERTADLTALADSGNTLTDPVTGKGVVVAEAEALATLFPPGGRPARQDLLDPVGGLARLGKKTAFCLLPYRAVGVERGLLLALRVDEWILNGRKQGPVLVALSPTPVSDGGGYRALVGLPDGKDGAW